MVASVDVVSASQRSAGGAGSRLTRRELLRAGGAIALAGVAGTAAGDELSSGLTVLPVNHVLSSVAPADPQFRTRPDLRIPALSVARISGGLAGGLIFIAPYNAPTGQQAGGVIVDNSGQPVWENPLNGLVTTNLQVQRYQGRAALTWWDGLIENGHGVGGYVIAGEDYTPLRQVQAGNGLHGDLHEFLLTDRGTALLTAYNIVTRDLSSVGGSKQGTIQDAIFQELDLASGRVLLEWHSLDNIPLSESYWPVYEPWDYVHINSIDVDHDGNLLVSSRNTHTVYKIDRHSGEVIWRLGGKSNEFSVASGAKFAWQHDVRRQANGTLTIFDNEGLPNASTNESRALVLAIDEPGRKASLLREYRHPTPLLATSQGSVQILPNGNVFVGWGAEPYVSEFSASGELLFDAQLGDKYLSYRAFRMPWTGAGPGAPRVAVRPRGRQLDVWASWNGDTRTRFWVVLAGGRDGPLVPDSARPRDGFETRLTARGDARRIAVRALDYGGKVLGESATVRV
jgi:outer membrane protein assembly factor BamB